MKEYEITLTGKQSYGSATAKQDMIDHIRGRHAELSAGLSHDRWHRYTRAGKLYTSVTTALGFVDKPWMQPWAEKMQRASDRLACIEVARKVAKTYAQSFGNIEIDNPAFDDFVGLAFDGEQVQAKASREIAEKAADLGTQVHALIEHEVNSRMGVAIKEPTVSDKAIELMMPWMRWADEVDLSPVLAEFGMYTNEGMMAGTGDLLAYVRGRLALLDWKTKPAIYLGDHMQSVGYRMIIKKMGVVPEDVEVDGIVVRIPKRAGEAPVCEEVPVDASLDAERWETLKALAAVRMAWTKDDKQMRKGGRA